MQAAIGTESTLCSLLGEATTISLGKQKGPLEETSTNNIYTRKTFSLYEESYLPKPRHIDFALTVDSDLEAELISYTSMWIVFMQVEVLPYLANVARWPLLMGRLPPRDTLCHIHHISGCEIPKT